jgi:hypothetical protein
MSLRKFADYSANLRITPQICGVSTVTFHQIDFSRNFRKVVCVDEIAHSSWKYVLFNSSGSGNFFGDPKIISRILKKFINPGELF